ncbi:PTS system cellobiose-specific IIB component [Gracilibacillus halotolerans]|uniref:PTS system cellobiose-specific IIB component n=1 Tax=Gracilibacillus halotolerans TaxID=74386 RepID=A0A841RR41_9BACI|nr:PTS sugar transporter subunit IIB [Gracilibacillus halotolerans]MBB6514292.1 PTS system cellobiose-specific IIB component [Gracilibacillus halotolerans]
MKRILLVCSAGMSTSMLVNKMDHAAEEKGLEIEIHAISEYDLNNHLQEVDVLLIAPQIRFLEDKIRKIADPMRIKVDIIDFSSYGMLQGDKILEQALHLIDA